MPSKPSQLRVEYSLDSLGLDAIDTIEMAISATASEFGHSPPKRLRWAVWWFTHTEDLYEAARKVQALGFPMIVETKAWP